MADNKFKTFKYKEVIEEEDKHLYVRRAKLFGEENAEKLDDTRFGIALSGGGIRSATINLGFLKTLNRFGILPHADYISTVSGGGYTGAYVQGTLKAEGTYQALFKEEHIEYMRSRGIYLFPGKGLGKLWNQFVLVVGFVISLLMSWISPAIVVLLGMGLFLMVEALVDFDYSRISENLKQVYYYSGIVIIFIFVLHYLINVLQNFNLFVSSLFNKLESSLIAIAGICAVFAVLLGFNGLESPEVSKIFPYLAMGLFLFIAGMFTNPNATSFHRFYRKQLSEAFLHFSKNYKNVSLGHLFKTQSDNIADFLAPYPLVNTCLNLQSSNDPNFQGTKASDYFLLSPKFCGAKLTGYVRTDENKGYMTMTLPAAVTISAAAINPGMGIYSNKLLSILTTVFNARLGYWAWNPLKLKTRYPVVWWPLYFFFELFSKIGTNNKMLNISDGGHIENLAVYELLRRKCKLIFAVDAGADPLFSFLDLENLTIRARNELGIAIRFRKGQDPEDIIRAKPSHGYSRKRFAVADLYQIWDKVKDENGETVIEHYENKVIGTFIYIKSSVLAPQGRPDIPKEDWLKYGTYKYKIYHPEFPHEPTSDQFFDPIQWESYYQLGQYLAADVLGLEDFEAYQDGKKLPYPISTEQLLTQFSLPMLVPGEEPEDSPVLSMPPTFEPQFEAIVTKEDIPVEFSDIEEEIESEQPSEKFRSIEPQPNVKKVVKKDVNYKM